MGTIFSQKLFSQSAGRINLNFGLSMFIGVIL